MKFSEKSKTTSCQVSYWLFYVIYSLHTLPLMAENIAVYNEHQIVCIADENSTIFFDPPRRQGDSSRPISVEDDWQTKTSSLSYFGAVTDKRWEDFAVVQEDYMTFTLHRSLAFSVYTKEIEELKIFVTNDDFLETDSIKMDKNDQAWMHFHYIIKDKNVYLYENNELLSHVTNFFPHQFEVKTDKKTYWKMHNYNWQFSDTASTEWTKVDVSDSCLVIYASTCPYCYMDVSTSTGQEYSLRSNNSATTWGWTSQKLFFPDNRNNYINIFRKTSNNDTDNNYWALDIRHCPKETNSGKVIYETTVDEKLKEETVCSTLDAQKLPTNTNKSETTGCERGKLGGKCDIACEEIITDNEFCENRMICIDRNCTCAWNCHGPYCQENSCTQNTRHKREIGNLGNECESKKKQAEARSRIMIKKSKTKESVAGVVGSCVFLGAIFQIGAIIYYYRKRKNSNTIRNVDSHECEEESALQQKV